MSCLLVASSSTILSSGGGNERGANRSVHRVSGAERISACSSGSVLASLSPAIRSHSRRHRLLREERAKCHKHGKHACLHHQSPLSCIVCLLPRLTAPASIIRAAQLALTKTDTNGQNTSSKTERRQNKVSCSSCLEHSMKWPDKPIY